MGRFGQTLSIDGNRLIVGSHDPGRVIAHYELNTTLGTWEKIFEQDLGNRYMEALDLDGDTLIVSDVRYDGAVTDQGLAEIWRYDSGAQQWNKEATLHHPAPVENWDNWGRESAIKGDIALVGNNGVDVDDGGTQLVNAGLAAIWQEVAPGSWSQVAMLTPPTGSYAHGAFATGLDVADTDSDGNGDVIAVTFQNGVSKDWSGNVLIWERQPDDTWTNTATLAASDKQAHAHFGRDVAISDNGTIVVGAYVHDDTAVNSGKVYAYRKIGSTWTEVGALSKAQFCFDGDEPLSRLGMPVARG